MNPQSMILQNAVRLYDGTILRTIFPLDEYQYEDTKGNVLTIAGGLAYFKNSPGFPGAGCEDLCLTNLDTEEYIYYKLVIEYSGQLVMLKDMNLKDIDDYEAQASIPNWVNNILNYARKEKLNAN